jgi:hypothetical protein
LVTDKGKVAGDVALNEWSRIVADGHGCEAIGLEAGELMIVSELPRRSLDADALADYVLRGADRALWQRDKAG